jgi:hypothetical protein
MQNKNHLTPEGLNEIIALKAGMNKGRLPSSFDSHEVAYSLNTEDD